MADQAPAEQPKKKSKKVLALVIIATVAGLQGVGFFILMKSLGSGPTPTHGGPSGEHVVAPEPSKEEGGSVEMALLERFKVPNTKSGYTVIYDFDISVVIPAARKEKMEEILKTRAAEIGDRVAQTIRQAPPRVLGEDDFATLRMQLKQGLSEIAGDEQTIQRVLIPRCVPMRTD